MKIDKQITKLLLNNTNILKEIVNHVILPYLDYYIITNDERICYEDKNGEMKITNIIHKYTNEKQRNNYSKSKINHW